MLPKNLWKHLASATIRPILKIEQPTADELKSAVENKNIPEIYQKLITVPLREIVNTLLTLLKLLKQALRLNSIACCGESLPHKVAPANTSQV